MRTLRIERNGRLMLDGEIADLNQLENKEEFLSSILTLDVEFEDGLNIADIVHFFYDAKGLVQNIFSEEYEVVRTLVSASNLAKNYKAIRMYKSFKIEKEITEGNQEFMYMIPEIELVPSSPGEDGIRNVQGLPIIIDDNIKLSYNDIEIESKTKLNLFDVMTCLFDELPSLLKEGLVLS